MTTGGDISVMHKKARSGRAEIDTHEMTWAKAIRLSLERLSDRLLNLPLTVRALDQTRHPLAGLEALLGDGDRMIMLLEGKGGSPDGRGVAMLGRGLVQTMLEVQTRGYVTRADLDTRPFTNTDAAVAARLIDPVLASVDVMMEEGRQDSGKLDLRFGDRIGDVRTLFLALDAPDYEMFQVTIDVDGDARSADLILAVPAGLLAATTLAPEGETTAEDGFEISATALSAPVTLDAVLDRLELPLSRICALRPGDVLAIPGNVLERTELLGTKGFLLGKVSLGQINRFRAVRLEIDDDGPPVLTPPSLAAQEGIEYRAASPPAETSALTPLINLASEAPDPDPRPNLPEAPEPTLEALAHDLELPDLATADPLTDLSYLSEMSTI